VSVFELLEGEWRRLRSDRGAARRLAEICRVAGAATSLADVEDYVRSAGPEEADAVLLALVRRAVEGDGLAARVLLQLLLPGTRNLARRWWAIGDQDERAAAAVTAVYQRICHYPVERRPGRVAANVLMDAARELRRSVPRVVVTLSAEPADTVPGRAAAASPPPEHAAVELAEVLLDAVDDGVLRREDAMLIARSRIAVDRVADMARHGKIGSRTLWDRRHRAERTLAAAYTAPGGAVEKEACAP
jgi:hypothetical protein